MDPKQFEPKKTRWAISNAKNQGWRRPAQGDRGFGKLTADVIGVTAALAANNALDFDDLLLLPVQRLQNEQVRTGTGVAMCWWIPGHQPHQYDLIKLLVTDGRSSDVEDWSGVGVCGRRRRPTSQLPCG